MKIKKITLGEPKPTWDISVPNIEHYITENGCVSHNSSSRPSSSFEKEEPITLNIFNRRVTGGEFTVCNPYLITDLEKMGIWNENIKNEIIMNNGSVQGINFNKYLDSDDKKYENKVKRLEHLIEKYKTVWEIPQKEIINMAADRGPFIDQSQSTNIFMMSPTPSKLLSSMLYAWKAGLKTGSYYIRTKSISTGAKHLAIDVSNINLNGNGHSPAISSNNHYQTTTVVSEHAAITPTVEIMEEEPLPEKPVDSPFECFGCSS